MILVPGQTGGEGGSSAPSSDRDPTPDPESAGLPRVIITIDGPAGTGKSSVARLLAKRLGLDFLDTGAMYRAAAVVALDNNLDESADPDAVIDAVAREDLHFDWSKDPPEMLCSGTSVAHRLRDPAVTGLVSYVAAIGGLRHHMVRKQRLVANQHPRLVTEGRDQGSVVFPDADVKFYLEASPEVRAHRRAGQLREANPEREVDEKAILENIVTRDAADSSRADGPLICPDDAERLDTSDMGFEAVVAHLEAAVRAALAPAALNPAR